MHARHLVLIAALFVGACFSKPGFQGSPDDGGTGDGPRSDAPGSDALADAPVDAPTDAPPATRLAFSKVSAGGRHACGIDANTNLWCWGRNGYGELGPSTPVATGTPILASPDTGWTEVAAGVDHTCGIRNGGLYCWGRNDSAQVIPHTGTTPALTAPITAVTLTGVTPKKVFAGQHATCVIATNDTLRCWGMLEAGFNMLLFPVTTVTGGQGAAEETTFKDVAIANEHTCVLSMTGKAYCWGDSAYLQLGDSTSDQFVSQARLVPGGFTFKSLASAFRITCGVTTADALMCWGAPAGGHLGNVGTNQLPFVVDAVRAWSTVTAGQLHICGNTASGVYCYGENDDGALGTGLFSRQLTIGAPAASNASAVVSGDRFACALDATTSLLSCWGSNSHGQLGNGQIASKREPSTVLLPPLGATEEIHEIRAGDAHTCALVGPPAGNWRAVCWGDNSKSQVKGTGTEIGIEIPVDANPAPFRHLAVGGVHSCGLDEAGATITCWGDNASGQLGRATLTPGTHSIASATLTQTTSAWTSVAAGSTTTCGTVASGDLYCWGTVPGDTMRTAAHHYGKVGSSQWPWQSVSIGSGFVLGLATNPNDALQPDQRRLFGFGDKCQLGDATSGTVSPTTPAELLTGRTLLRPHVAAAHSSGAHACVAYHWGNAGTPAPRITCYGENGSGQVSGISHQDCDGAEDPPLAAGWKAPAFGVATLATAADHSCALTANNQVVCWGGNARDELAAIAGGGTPTVLFAGAWSEVTTGRYHSCAINLTRNAISCWGENKQGQLGDGTRFHASPTPSGIVPP